MPPPAVLTAEKDAVLSKAAMQAAQLQLQGRWDEAEAIYKAIFKAQPNHFDAKQLLGDLRFRQGRFDEAQKLLRQAIAIKGSVAQTHLMLGKTCSVLQRLEDALKSADRAIALQSDFADAHYLRGTVARQLGRPAEALASYNRALAINPDAADILFDKAELLSSQNRPEEALSCYNRVLVLKPDHLAAHNNLGNLLVEMGRAADALECFETALSINPSSAEVLYNFGQALQVLQRLAEALVYYEKALAVKPDYFDAYNNCSIVLLDLDRPLDALALCEKALKIKPDLTGALNNQGLAFQALKRFDDALASFDRAIAIAPDFIQALINRGICLLELNRAEESMLIFQRLLSNDQNHLETLLGYGYVLGEMGRAREAIAVYDRALQVSPGHAKAEFDRAWQCMLLGDFETGWKGRERRFDRPSMSKRWTAGQYANWTGQPIAGKRIIVYDEQGIGDVIQFARYLPLLTELGADVTFLTMPHIRRLLGSLTNGITFAERDPDGPFDFQCQLLSLPSAFNTTVATIPNRTPYLWAEPTSVSTWARFVADENLKVGIAWQGNPVGKIDIGRSIPLRAFAPLAAIAGVRLISLQKNYGLDQLPELPLEMRVEALGSDFDAGPDAFIDTAAVMANLDLVITSDTSIAHLAGALGRPVWLVLKRVPDWRWMLDREDSPWYPTMRLYRQTTRGDWAGIFARIAADLSQLIGTPKS